MAATRRPQGPRVFVALDEVHPDLRARAADKLIDRELARRQLLPEDALVLRMVAARPRRRPDGQPYGVWCSAADAARVRAGKYPLGKGRL